jgi:hypothetical protein
MGHVRCPKGLRVSSAPGSATPSLTDRATLVTLPLCRRDAEAVVGDDVRGCYGQDTRALGPRRGLWILRTMQKLAWRKTRFVLPRYSPQSGPVTCVAPTVRRGFLLAAPIRARE